MIDFFSLISPKIKKKTYKSFEKKKKKKGMASVFLSALYLNVNQKGYSIAVIATGISQQEKLLVEV